MKRILVAVDGSEPAYKGLRMAAEIARGAKASLDLIYVRLPNLLPAQVYAEVIEKIEREEQKHASELLAKAAAEAKALEVPAEQISMVGSPAEAIADVAESQNAWMVVVGSRGRNPVARVLLGSVADRVVHICKKPVLVVR
ncbi:MAG: universal stress protein [Myxococcota bacterium]